MSWCNKCGGYVYPHMSHKCPPAYRVWEPDIGESIQDATIVYATNAENAVEGWAEKSDAGSAEYSIVRGHEAKVRVCKEEDYIRVNNRLDLDTKTEDWDGDDVEERIDILYGKHIEMEGWEVTGEAVPQYSGKQLDKWSDAQ